MKSEIVPSEVISAIAIPSLMQFDNDWGTYVLFVTAVDGGYLTGTVVASEHGGVSVGETGSRYIRSAFRPFDGKVVLQND